MAATLPRPGRSGSRLPSIRGRRIRGAAALPGGAERARLPLRRAGRALRRPLRPALAEEFAEKLGEERDGWRLHREERPLAVGGDLFLPDFTLSHPDGREALVEIVGFWTPEYLEAKLRKVREAGLAYLILVVYRGLAAGDEGEGTRRRIEEAAVGPVIWFVNRPRIGPVMEATEAVARMPRTLTSP